MSTDIFLRKMNLKQLRYARDKADALIREKESEPKLVVWRVVNNFMCLANFGSDEYIKAAEFLLKEAKELNELLPAKEEPADSKLSLDFMLVPASEYHKYVPDGRAGEAG